jgi:hypothetical protein
MTVDVNTAIVLVDGHHLPATLERSNLRRRRDVNLRMVGSSGGVGAGDPYPCLRVQSTLN